VPQVKTKDVTDFLSHMVDLMMTEEVDDAGYVVNKATRERVLIGEEGQKRPILLYQEEIKDQNALILNPIAEGLGEPLSAQWFYQRQRVALFVRINTLCRRILQACVIEKQKKPDSEEQPPLALELMKIASLVIEDVDEKILDEFAQITAKLDNELFAIYYSKKHIHSVFRCGLFDLENAAIPTFRAKFPKIRKKTWTVMDRLILAIFGINDGQDFSKFTRKPTVVACVRLSSFLNVILGIYQEVNPLLDLINRNLSIDLSKLVHHINNLSDYSDNAKFMVQPNRVPIPTPPQAIPGHRPHGIPASSGYIAADQNVTLIPGPRMANGQQLPPTQVINSSLIPSSQIADVGMYNQLPPAQHYGQQFFPQQQNPNTFFPVHNPPFNPPYYQDNRYIPGNTQSTGLMPGLPPAFPPLY